MQATASAPREAATRPVTLLLCALGGEGGGVLAEWLYSASVRAGHAAQSTSIPGVAQRTGATTYYVEIHPQAMAATAGRRPVFSLNPVPGGIDLLISSELLETARQVGNGMSSARRTCVISSSSRALTVAEKMQMTDGRADDAALVASVLRHASEAEFFDMPALAQSCGAALSAVMYGAVSASGVLPWARAIDEATMAASGKGGVASLRGFAAGFEAIDGARQRRQALLAAADPATASTELMPIAEPTEPNDQKARSVVTEPDLRSLARARLLDYQDAAYVALYEQRLARIEAAASAAPPSPDVPPGAIAHEMTRWLALWMAFDDLVRVAQLKLANSRQLRVRREVAATDDEIVKVFEHFKPGVAEFAGLLPTGLAHRLQAWDRRRVQRGQEPWSLALRVGTHTVLGALALRCMAGLKFQRRRGSRFGLEQQLIERWVGAVERGATEHAALGHELALCGRMIKGYGSTNERGKDNLLHIIDHLALGSASADQRAAAVRSARMAALADDAGIALDQTLVAHGAPARPVREQTIRWFKRRPGAV